MRLTITPTSLALFTSILSLFTPLTHAKDGAIVFCNEKDFTGDCTIAYEFDWNKCFWIPDYKAKADKGSSFKVLPDSNSTCSLYHGTHCDGNGATSQTTSIPNLWDIDKPYKTFMCQRRPDPPANKGGCGSCGN